MGYDGRVDRNRRNRGVVVNEINKIIQTGLEMMDIVKEFRGHVDNKKLKNLDMRIGIHTGKVIAGVIGSKFVRYDVFGEGVVISQKVEKEGVIGKVTISDDTRKLLNSVPDVAESFTTQVHKDIYIPAVDRHVELYTIERNDSSFNSDILHKDDNYANSS